MILMTMMILRHVMRTGNVIRMEVMVVKMMDHKGALSAHDDHVLVAVLVAGPHGILDERVPCHDAQEHDVLVDLVSRERLEGLLIGERAVDGRFDGLDCGYHGFSFPFCFIYMDSWLFRVLIR